MALIDVVGWVGTLGVLVAFAMISRRGVTPSAQVVNAWSGAALTWYATAHHATALALLNLAWVVIAVWWLVRDSIREVQA